MFKTVKITSLPYNTEFYIGQNKYVSKGTCLVNNNYVTVIKIEGNSDGIHYLTNDTEVKIETEEVYLKNIGHGQKFQCLKNGLVYTKLTKDMFLYIHDIHDKTFALHSNIYVTIFDSDTLVFPVK